MAKRSTSVNNDRANGFTYWGGEWRRESNDRYAERLIHNLNFWDYSQNTKNTIPPTRAFRGAKKMGSKKTNVNLAALLSLLGGGIGGSPMNEHDRILARSKFTPLDDHAKDVLTRAKRKLAEFDPADVSSVTITVVHRTKPGEPCDGCGDIHDPCVALYSGVIGDKNLAVHAMGSIGQSLIDAGFGRTRDKDAEQRDEDWEKVKADYREEHGTEAPPEMRDFFDILHGAFGLSGRR